MNLPENVIPVLNVTTQALGLAVAVEPSPYIAEELAGISRVKVWAECPGAGGIGMSWDWWLLSDVVRVTVASEDTLLVAAIA